MKLKGDKLYFVMGDEVSNNIKYIILYEKLF